MTEDEEHVRATLVLDQLAYRADNTRVGCGAVINLRKDGKYE